MPGITDEISMYKAGGDFGMKYAYLVKYPQFQLTVWNFLEHNIRFPLMDVTKYKFSHKRVRRIKKSAESILSSACLTNQTSESM